ncbi:MAG: hypothetical protein QUS33_13670 [Dehalococcoidia bacterium]|nr:hypothetical protein [Dehalococcoidia bacterium]
MVYVDPGVSIACKLWDGKTIRAGLADFRTSGIPLIENKTGN